MEDLKLNIKAFINKVKQYRFSDSDDLTICKVWNRGMGRLSLVAFFPAEKVVLINSALFNNSDGRKLHEFCRDNHIEDWEWKTAYYGYPVYYNNGFNLKLLEK